MTLRNYIVLTIFSFLILTITYGQGKEDKSYAIFKIKKAYQEINRYKKYTTVTIDNSQDFLGYNTDNGGSLEGYYKGDSLKKIIEWVGLSNKVFQNEYYFENGKLFFVYSTEDRYKLNDASQNIDYSKLESVFKGRYYFDNEKLISTILSDSKHNNTKHADAASFLKSSKEYLKLLGDKKH